MQRPDPSASTGVSRRELLQGATAGLAIAATGAVLTGCSPAGQTPGSASGAPGAISPESLPTRFSQDEMDRRFAAVRAAMNEQGFDGLLLSHRPDGNGDIGYLTHTGALYAVFGMDGNAIAIGEGSEGNLHDGVEAVPAGDDLYASHINDAIGRLGLTRGRIGVGYLSGIVRLPEGGFSYATLDKVRRANPQARFEPASDLLLMVKLPRSPEEVAVLEQAHTISEMGLQTLMETARPGSYHRDAWLAVYNTMVGTSSESPTRLSLRSGAEGNTGGHPIYETMNAGTICNQEISASVLGYGSQVNQSFLIGGPAPEDWESAGQYCINLFHRLVDYIKPGNSVMEAVDYYVAEVEKRGEGYWGVVFHSGGNNDGPRWGPGRPEATEAVFQEGMVFTIKPRIPIKGLEAPTAQFGDGVVVTATGARRLGKRPLELVTIT